LEFISISRCWSWRCYSLSEL